MAANQEGLFKGQQYINLETFRKNGEAVRTPVWFAQEGGKLYVWTSGSSGKVKRIRRSGQIRLAPSDARGSVLSDWVPGEAHVYNPGSTEYQHGSQLINRKYGLLKRLFELLGSLRRESGEAVIIEVTLCD